MNRRAFITALGLAPVAGVMAARDAMAAPAVRDSISHTFGSFEFVHGEAFIGERIGESPFITPNQARKIFAQPEIFGVDNIAPEIRSRLAADESVSAQFADD